MLQHPVLWQFVSALFPKMAVVKSHHMRSWLVKHSVCFIVYFPPGQTGHGGMFTQQSHSPSVGLPGGLVWIKCVSLQ